eukprot:scaffold327699_cov66-Tisochrysis_lutea.AAC.1
MLGWFATPGRPHPAARHAPISPAVVSGLTRPRPRPLAGPPLPRPRPPKARPRDTLPKSSS